MGWDHLIAFNIALIAAIVTPGPALLYSIRTTLAGGRAVGLATGFGLATMAGCWTLLALLGLETVFDLFPWAYGAFKIGGALYLIYVGWVTWRGASSPVSHSNAQAAKRLRRAFGAGFLMNLGNPKSALFAAAVLVVIFPPHLGVGDKALIVTNHIIIEVVFYGLVAFAMASPAVSNRYLRAKKQIDRVAAVVMAALGVRLATSD
ncbi:MAG: LysE family translocator [Pikeienuella sp.]